MPDSMESSGRWQAVAGFELLSREYEDGHVVFHAGSGDTHLVDDIATDLLRTLQQAPADIAELSAQVAARLALAPDDALGYTRELLSELERLALVERET